MAKLLCHRHRPSEVIDQAGPALRWQGRRLAACKVEQLYREIRALRIYEGTSEVQKLVIAGATVKALAGGG